MSAECLACSGAWPRADHRIAQSGLTLVALQADQYYPGASVLVLKRHATELFQLSRDERARLIEEVSAVAAVLYDMFGARKVNYALLGNQIPHLHWHLVPRLPGDPAPVEPPWALPHPSCPLAGAALRARVEAIRDRLGREGFAAGPSPPG